MGRVLAEVLRYLCEEVLGPAGDYTRTQKFLSQDILPQHLLQAVGHDEELNQLWKGVIIPGGGVIDRQALLPDRHLIRRSSRFSSRH